MDTKTRGILNQELRPISDFYISYVVTLYRLRRLCSTQNEQLGTAETQQPIYNRVGESMGSDVSTPDVETSN